MIEFAVNSFLVAIAVNFAMVLMDKWGIREWLQRNAPCDFLYRLFTCDFCTSFWLSLALCVVLVPFFGAEALVYPIFSASLLYLMR